MFENSRRGIIGKMKNKKDQREKLVFSFCTRNGIMV
jgi:hypothetical protein